MHDDNTPIPAEDPVWLLRALGALDLLGPIGSAVNLLASETAVVREARVQQFLADLAQLCAGRARDPLDDSQRQRVLELLHRSVEAAARSMVDGKVALLARVAADGITNRAKIDESLFITRTLGELEPFHLTAMQAVRAHRAVIDEDESSRGNARPIRAHL